MSFYDKYMKYKKKYLELVGGSQNQHDGATRNIIYNITNKITKVDIISFIISVGINLNALIGTVKTSNDPIYKRVNIYVGSNFIALDNRNINKVNLEEFVTRNITDDTYKVDIILNKGDPNTSELKYYMTICIEGNIKSTGTIKITHEECTDFDYTNQNKVMVGDFLNTDEFKKINDQQSIALYHIISTILSIKKALIL